MKKLKTQTKIVILEIIGFILSVLPLLLVMIIHSDRYFKTAGSSIRLGAGAVIVIVLILLKSLDKLKISGAITIFAVIFVLSYLLESVLSDLTLLSGMALLGQAVDQIIIAKFVNKLKENKEDEKQDERMEKQAQSISKSIEDMLNKFSSTGRT